MFYFENERIHSVTLIFKIKARALITVQRRPSFLKSKAFIVAVMAQEVQHRHGTSARLLLLHLQRREAKLQQTAKTRWLLALAAQVCLLLGQRHCSC